MDTIEIQNPSKSEESANEDSLVLSLDGFEGPIDLLLNLAREQKVDLSKIAILPLAEQYLKFIVSARKLRLEIAADYLVMAAWLAFLKSRLLLPVPEGDEGEPDPLAMAEALKFQLLRLEAMQGSAKSLQALPQLGSEVFLRGWSDPIKIEEKPIYFLPIQDLLLAIGAPLRRRKADTYNIIPSRLFSLEESVLRLRGLLGVMPSWGELQKFLPLLEGVDQPLEIRSATASMFAATLELVKNGELELRQDGSFSPLYLRRREKGPEQTEETHNDKQ